MEEQETKARLVEFEARLIAQDHRLLSVLNNFFIERRKWPAGDPRREASVRALIWCIFFSPGTVAVAGASIGLATLAVLIWQNTLIKQQNDYFQAQVAQQQQQIESQDRIVKQSQRSDAIRVIYGSEYAENPRVKSEAVRTLVVLERSNIAEGANVLSSDYVNLHDANLDRLHIERFDLRKVSFRNSKLRGAALMSVDLRGSAFFYADLAKVNLFRSDLRETFWNSADLSEASLEEANLEGANMVNVKLRGANLRDLKNWRSLYIKGADITGVQNAPQGFVDWALANGARADASAPAAAKVIQ